MDRMQISKEEQEIADYFNKRLTKRDKELLAVMYCERRKGSNDYDTFILEDDGLPETPERESIFKNEKLTKAQQNRLAELDELVKDAPTENELDIYLDRFDTVKQLLENPGAAFLLPDEPQWPSRFVDTNSGKEKEGVHLFWDFYQSDCDRWKEVSRQRFLGIAMFAPKREASKVLLTS